MGDKPEKKDSVDEMIDHLPLFLTVETFYGIAPFCIIEHLDAIKFRSFFHDET